VEPDGGKEEEEEEEEDDDEEELHSLLIQEDDVLVTYEELALVLFLLTHVANFVDFMENTIVLFLGEDFLIDRTEKFHLELAQEEQEEEEEEEERIGGGGGLQCRRCAEVDLSRSYGH
jgi:hypothetical protein